MVNQVNLSAVLTDFARTLATDFPIQQILDHLVERIVGVLPITAAGVTLITAGAAPRYVAASDAAALRFEQLQAEIDQGPCRSAYESGQAVAIPDLSADARYPEFAPAAVEAGLAAVFTFPLHHESGCLGALDLYRDTPGNLDVQDMEAAQTLADVTTAYLLNAQARTEARATSDAFRHGALHDSLTGLPNRMMLHDRIDHAVRRATRSHTNAAILFADLDRFKTINDTYGHNVGDELLRAVADRLQRLLRPGDTLARSSGDEFVFMCEDLHHASDAEALAARIGEAFARPFILGTIELTVTASVGVAFTGPGQAMSAQLLIDADTAMYQAKRNGGARHQTVDHDATRLAQQRNDLEVALRSALERDELTALYRPVVTVSDRSISGVEALPRWELPSGEQIAAPAVVEIAERAGLGNEIGAWLLDRACRDRACWLREPPYKAVDVTVNISARQLLSSGLPAAVADILTETDTDPSALILEITENIVVDDSKSAVAAMTELQALGVRIALDDFGTGRCSLSDLRGLPVDIIKIDQSLIAEVSQSPGAAAIVKAVTQLGHALTLEVTADGVDTHEQHQKIAEIGCESAQGFFYGRPMAAPELVGSLRASS